MFGVVPTGFPAIVAVKFLCAKRERERIESVLTLAAAMAVAAAAASFCNSALN